MSSGTITGTTTNQYISCKLVWSAVDDAANNRSRVTVSLWLRKSSSSTSHTTGRGYFRLSFMGGTYSFIASAMDIPNDNVWRSKHTWDFGYIAHDANGARSIAMSMLNSGDYSGLPGTSYTDTYCSGTAKLTTYAPPVIQPPVDPEPPVDPTPDPSPVELTATHTVIQTGLVQRAMFTWPVMNSGLYAPHFHVIHKVAGQPDTTIYDGDLVDAGVGMFQVQLNQEVTAGDQLVATAILDHGAVAANTPWEMAFYETLQTDEDNTWTCLGYADDQLVGMTANNQIWNGRLGEFKLANAARIDDPSIMVFTDLAVVDGGTTPLTLSAALHDPDETHRQTIRYTLLNEFGPTMMSDPLTFYSSKPFTEWTSASYIRISGKAPLDKGVTAIELYFTSGENQVPAFLGRVNFPEETTHAPEVTTKDWTFNWTGQADTSLWVAANLTAPTQNYTVGVPASKMAVLDGQLYFWGGTDPYRIWIGGNPGNRFSVSPGTGGGFVDVDPGVGTEVKRVMKFKTQQGAAIVTALCDNANSERENRYNLVESSISLSDTQSVKGWMAEKIAGAVGCKSSNGAVAAGDGLYAISRYGLAITTLTMEYNSQLQVMYVSDPIAPVFLKQYGHQLDAAVLFAVNGVLYMTFGAEDSTLDNVIFCYDIALKAWYSYTLDTHTPILNMIHVDFDGEREGIGIITADAVYLMPTTKNEAFSVLPEHEVLIESGALTTMQPLQAMHHLSQLEFRFDYFIGEMDIVVTMVDQFGRIIKTTRTIKHDTVQHSLSEYIRIDSVVESYKVVLQGKARMRLTHFLAKLYPKSNRIGMTWGFDSQQSHNTPGSIHRTFASYNDVKEAIIP